MKVSLDIPKDEYDALLRQAELEGLRKPSDPPSSAKGIAPLLKRRLAAGVGAPTPTPQTPPEPQAPEDDPELPPPVVHPMSGKQVAIWYPASSRHAIKHTGTLLCIDESIVSVRLDDRREIKFFDRENIIGQILWRRTADE